MAVTPTEILEIFGQIGSVNKSDYVLLHQAASNTTKKITAELFLAYLDNLFGKKVIYCTEEEYQLWVAQGVIDNDTIYCTEEE